MRMPLPALPSVPTSRLPQPPPSRFRVALGIGFPLFLLIGMSTAFLWDPMLMLTGFLLAMLTWTRPSSPSVTT